MLIHSDKYLLPYRSSAIDIPESLRVLKRKRITAGGLK